MACVYCILQGVRECTGLYRRLIQGCTRQVYDCWSFSLLAYILQGYIEIQVTPLFAVYLLLPSSLSLSEPEPEPERPFTTWSWEYSESGALLFLKVAASSADYASRLCATAVHAANQSRHRPASAKRHSTADPRCRSECFRTPTLPA